MKDIIPSSKKRSLSTSTTDISSMLKDITQIEYSLHAYLDSSGRTTDSITSYINLSREYIIRWNPINATFNSDVIFTIPSMSYALVVCDFKHCRLNMRILHITKTGESPSRLQIAFLLAIEQFLYKCQSYSCGLKMLKMKCKNLKSLLGWRSSFGMIFFFTMDFT